MILEYGEAQLDRLEVREEKKLGRTLRTFLINAIVSVRDGKGSTRTFRLIYEAFPVPDNKTPENYRPTQEELFDQIVKLGKISPAILATSNFGDESFTETFFCKEICSLTAAWKLRSMLNEELGPESPIYYRVVSGDHKPYIFEP